MRHQILLAHMSISIEEFTGWIKFLKVEMFYLYLILVFWILVLRGAKPKIQNNAKEDSILEAETTNLGDFQILLYKTNF